MEQRVGVQLNSNYLVITNETTPRSILNENHPMDIQHQELDSPFTIVSQYPADTCIASSLDFFTSFPYAIICQYNMEGDDGDSDYPCILIDTTQYPGNNYTSLKSCSRKCLVILQYFLRTFLDSVPSGEVTSTIRSLTNENVTLDVEQIIHISSNITYISALDTLEKAIAKHINRFTGGGADDMTPFLLEMPIINEDNSKLSLLSCISYSIESKLYSFQFALVERLSTNAPVVPESTASDDMETESEIEKDDDPTEEAITAEPELLHDQLNVFPVQRFVAEAMFQQTCNILHCPNLRTKFDSLQFFLFVPKFRTLSMQTVERLEQFRAFLNLPEESCEQLVTMYPFTRKKEAAKFTDFVDDVCCAEKSRTLVVVIVDECHYSPTKESIPFLHDPRLHAAENFIAVMVSATPFNCLSTQSCIPKENIITWGEVAAKKGGGAGYVSFGFYCNSIKGNHFSTKAKLLVKIDNNPVREVPLNIKTLLWSWTNVADALSSLSEIKDYVKKFTYDRSSMRFSCESTRKTGCMIMENEFLMSLGFNNNIDLATINIPAGGQVWPLTSSNEFVHVNPHQFIRCEDAFQHMKVVLEEKFRGLRNTNTLPPPLSTRRQSIKFFQESYWPNDDPLLESVPARNGYIVIVDYLLSIAFYGACFTPIWSAAGKHYDLAPTTVAARVIAERYVLFLEQSSCLEMKYAKTQGLCNLVPIVKEALCRRLGLAASNTLTLDIISRYLEGKVSGQVPPTETDRIVHRLICERDVLNGFAPMVLMRCFDNDENKSMQILLQYALLKCGLCLHGRPAFSVICDIGKTNIYNAVDPYYKSYPRSNSATLNELYKANKGLKYEDFKGVPCLIILCEKGRMGDTFPHTLCVLDMRLRTASAGSTFIQEMGRMCRYPAVKSGQFTSISDLRAKLDDGDDHARRLRANGVFIKTANALIGVVYSSAELNHLLDESKGNSYQQEDELIFDELVYPLPYAIIDQKNFGSIVSALEQQSLSTSSDQASMVVSEELQLVSKIDFPKGYDDYLKKQKATKDGWFALSAKKHYDSENTARVKHARRLLLRAECQIGKTGAFMYYLAKLSLAIGAAKDDEIVPSVTVIKPVPPAIKWLWPYWKDLQQQAPIDYSMPITGKYHGALLQQRLSNLALAWINHHQDSSMEKDDVITLWQQINQQAECLLSQRGMHCLKEIVNNTSVTSFDSSTVKRLVNFDGRMTQAMNGLSDQELEDMFQKLSLDLNKSANHHTKFVDSTRELFWKGVSNSDDSRSLLPTSTSAGYNYNNSHGLPSAAVQVMRGKQARNREDYRYVATTIFSVASFPSPETCSQLLHATADAFNGHTKSLHANRPVINSGFMISIPNKAIDSSRSCASSTKVEDWRKLTASLYEPALIKRVRLFRMQASQVFLTNSSVVKLHLKKEHNDSKISSRF